MGERGLAVFLSEPRFEALPTALETPGRPERPGPDRAEVRLAEAAQARGRSRANG